MMKKTALISVYYKDGLVDFVRELVKLDWDIVSTGGTLKTLREVGIEAIDVTEITGFPEILDGRVKTLSPQVFGGILFRREQEEHQKTIVEHNLRPIDMVVNILYPFEETVKDPNATKQDIIEKIDIGGPSMIRGAAKNYKDVMIVTSSEQYDEVINELKSNPNPSIEFKMNLAKKAFMRTAAYDIAIANYFMSETNEGNPEELFMHFIKDSDLRYGENPHQNASYYKSEEVNGTLNDAKIIQGKSLSYNNILDITAGLDFIADFMDRPTAIGIKHTNPCAIATSDNIEEAYDKCIEGDSESIFGGIIVLNEPVTAALAEKMTSFFLEIIIAPKIEAEAVEVFKKKPNLRVLEISTLGQKEKADTIFTRASGGILIQEKDNELYNELVTVTKREPSESELKDLIFAYKVVKCLKSNAIAIVKDGMTLGLGIGDVNRFFAATHALDMAGEEAKGAVVASDGFFPFADSIAEFVKYGVTAIIQPGGSIKDSDTIGYADENDIAMVFTGMRHFRH